MKLMKSYKTITSEKQIRKCLVTGVRTTKQHLMRFVVDPENQLVADINQMYDNCELYNDETSVLGVEAIRQRKEFQKYCRKQKLI